jgi:DNA-directed RNA polymerase subunit F
MIKDKKPLTMYEALEIAEELKETDRVKETVDFIKKFSNTDSKKANKIKEAIEALDIIKLRPIDIIKIVDILPESASELNKIFSETSLDADETSKILDVIKNNK